MASIVAAPGQFHGVRVVNRRFPASYRGRLVIVAGRVDRSFLRDPLVASTLTDSGLDVDQLPVEHALGFAELIDCHPAAGACCAPWGNTSSSWFHLVLDGIRALATPVRMSIRPGLPEPTRREHNELLAAR